MRVLGVHHVSINVHDVDEALDFYTEVLGLRRRDDRPDFGVGGAWLNAGGQQVHLIDQPPPNDAGQHFALQVADLGEAIAALRHMGIAVSDPFVTTAGRQAFLHDPSGNLVELNEPAGEERTVDD